MATNPYIVITQTDGTALRYKTIGFRPARRKGGQVNETVNGELDIVAGATFKIFKYVIRVPVDNPADANYGKFSELIEAIEEHTPAGNPSNMFQLTDHWQEDYQSCYFAPGNYDPDALTTMLEGSNAWFIVPVEIFINPIVFTQMNFSSQANSGYVGLL